MDALVRVEGLGTLAERGAADREDAAGARAGDEFVEVAETEDAGALVNALTDKDYRVTRLQSTGGFLKQSTGSILVGTIGWVATTWLRVKNGYPLESSWGKPLHPHSSNETVERVKLLTQENAQLRAEIGSMKDRLQVLERIATDPAKRKDLFLKAQTTFVVDDPSRIFYSFNAAQLLTAKAIQGFQDFPDQLPRFETVWVQK